MWEVPKILILSSGYGKGSSPLRAFDSALFDAHLGNYNLIKVTSIFPASAKLMRVNRDAINQLNRIQKGAFLPAVYTHIVSNKKNTVISAAISVSIPTKNEEIGVIFESTCTDRKGLAVDSAEKMCQEAMSQRQTSSFRVESISAENTVTDEEYFYCALAATVFLPGRI